MIFKLKFHMKEKTKHDRYYSSWFQCVLSDSLIYRWSHVSHSRKFLLIASN